MIAKPPKIIMQLDMNSYFASVEQQANPHLRGRSVGVCAYLSPRGTIIASSKEAKAKGIKTGCKVAEAKRLDPAVVLIVNDPAKYRHTTGLIFSIMTRYTDTVEPYSIDEAWLDLTGWAKTWSAAEVIAKKIQNDILAEVGDWLKCSVGLSYTKFLAKFASDITPKGEVLTITPDKLDDFLDRPLTDAWGINHRTDWRLKLLGINTLLELKRYDPIKLKRLLGRRGYYLWANVNGVEIDKVRHGTPEPKSVGHSYCLPQWTSDKGYLLAILYKLTEKTGRRLRLSGRQAYSLHFYLSYVSGGGLGKSQRFKTPLYTTGQIFTVAANWLKAWQLKGRVRLLAVSVSRLSPLSPQLDLFDQVDKRRLMSQAMDELNDRYGEYTVYAGAMWGTESAARDRIGFRKTVQLP